jgi:hypothetical protein
MTTNPREKKSNDTDVQSPDPTRRSEKKTCAKIQNGGNKTKAKAQVSRPEEMN